MNYKNFTKISCNPGEFHIVYKNSGCVFEVFGIITLNFNFEEFIKQLYFLIEIDESLKWILADELSKLDEQLYLSAMEDIIVYYISEIKQECINMCVDFQPEEINKIIEPILKSCSVIKSQNFSKFLEDNDFTYSNFDEVLTNCAIKTTFGCEDLQFYIKSFL